MEKLCQLFILHLLIFIDSRVCSDGPSLKDLQKELILKLGVWDEYEKGLQKPVEKCYIHQITSSNSDGCVIFTATPGLIELVHTATQIQGDGTFKCIKGKFDKYEITIWNNSLLLLDLVLCLTGKPLHFKALHGNSNLLAFGSDMEPAELKAAGESFK
ncbi:hypothetical protein GYMLUDRAFT_234797 [Collybiopsis luxurians FD-317 M1]|nr:hypothetical protein GYMLUDRAFT_234797 [Collybiopsis luxurians FD-317 M1]